MSPQKGNDSDSVYTLRGVLSLEDDTFWHFGLGLTLYESPDIKPYETAIIHILLKKIVNILLSKLKISKTNLRFLKINQKTLKTFLNLYLIKLKKIMKKTLKFSLNKKILL